MPLRTARNNKSTPVNMPGSVSLPVHYVGKPNQYASMFANVTREMSGSPFGDADAPDIVSIKSRTSLGSSFQSLDVYNGDFVFAPPHHISASKKDWKAPSMSKMPAASGPRDKPSRPMSSAAGFSPTFAFEAPQSLV